MKCIELLLAQGFGKKEPVHLFNQEMFLRSRLAIWIKAGKEEIKGERVGEDQPGLYGTWLCLGQDRFHVLSQRGRSGAHH